MWASSACSSTRTRIRDHWEGGVPLLTTDRALRAGLTAPDVAVVVAKERTELDHRGWRYRWDVSRRRAGGAGTECSTDRSGGAGGTRDMLNQLKFEADQTVSFLTLSHLVPVGHWNDNFDQTPDEGVANRLRDQAGAVDSVAARSHFLGRDVAIPTDGFDLEGRLEVVARAPGTVRFAHVGESNRYCLRNQSTARTFRSHGLGLLLFDLLSPTEAPDRRRLFDAALLGNRLEAATALIHRQPEIGTLTRGYLRASPGAAAALWATGSPDNGILAVVMRGGRPDRCNK